MERLSIIIFGATGFTGQYVVKYAADFCKERRLKFGIAGRRKEALEAVLKEFAPDAEDVPIFLADINNEESLKKMAEHTKVLVNCCGPYRFYGEQVVKACIATQTHYVDVTGEPQFMEKMQLLYNKAAQEAGIYIVSACGFDSIPMEMGVIYAQKKFEGEVNSIESYLTLDNESVVGPVINYGTYESAVYGLTHMKELKDLRAKLYPNRLPEFTPKLASRGFIHKSDVDERWSLPFLGSDRSVAIRTQRFFYDKYKARPVQVRTYITFKSFFDIVKFLTAAIIFKLMTLTAFTREILLKYPTLFSAGNVGHGNMSHKSLENSRFSMIFNTLGWSEKLTEPTDKHTNPPNKKLITRVSGAEPAYGTTSIALILSAIMILKEADKIPDNGGVLTPGVAFGKTSLIEELDKNNIKFEVIKCVNTSKY